MSAKLKTSAALVCSIGCVRKNNEDNFYFMGDVMTLSNINEGAHIVQQYTDATQLYAVMDGMGGQNSGERASCIAAELLMKRADRVMKAIPPTSMEEYACEASRIIYEDGVAQGMTKANQGTTLAMLLFKEGVAHVGNVGDSRVFLLREGKLHQLSKDHSPVYALYFSGQITELQMRTHPKNNIIDQYLGMNPAKMPMEYMYYASEELCAGDRFMLCSDGLTDLVPQEHIQLYLAEARTPDEAACKLVKTALERGGKDNTTCMVVDVVDDSLPAARPLSAQRAAAGMTAALEATTGG